MSFPDVSYLYFPKQFTVGFTLKEKEVCTGLRAPAQLGVAWAWRGRGLGARGLGVAWACSPNSLLWGLLFKKKRCAQACARLLSWAWRGRGLGVRGLGVAWAWLGWRGVGAAWAWAWLGRGRGLGVAWAWLGRGLGVALAWRGRGLGVAWAKDLVMLLWIYGVFFRCRGPRVMGSTTLTTTTNNNKNNKPRCYPQQRFGISFRYSLNEKILKK